MRDLTQRATDPRVEEILDMITKIASGDLTARETPSERGDDLDGIITGLNMLAEELSFRVMFQAETEQRLDEIKAVMTAIAARDFSKKASVSAEIDIFDAIAGGLNALGKELEASTVTKAYLDNIIDSMTDMLIVTNPDTTMRKVNRATLDLLGYSEAELIGRPIDKILAPEALKGIRPDDLIKTRFIKSRETTYRGKDGSQIPVSFSGSVMCDECDRVQGIVCVARDITEIKRAQGALRQSERRYRDLFERISDLIMTHDPEGRLLDVNPAVSKLSGYTFAEMIGRPLSDFIIPKFRHRFQDEYLTQIREQGRSEGVAIFQAKDGSQHYVEYRNVLVKQAGREPYVSGSGRDITERLWAERALVESEERLRSTIASLDDLVFVMDKNGIFIDYYQPSSKAESYIPPEEFVGKSFKDVWPPPIVKSLAAAIDAVQATDAVQQFDYSLPMDNQQWWFNAKVSMRIDKGGNFNGVTVVARNITDRKLAQEALQRAHDELEQRVKERTAELVEANENLLQEITERRQAEEALRQRVEELDALNLLARNVSSSLSVNQVLLHCYEQIFATVLPDLAVVYLREGDKLVLQPVKPEDPKFHQVGTAVMRVGDCLCGLAAAKGEPIYSKNIHTDSRCTLNECKQAGMHSFGAIPLRLGSDILGVLGVAATRERDFAQQAAFLEAFAGQIAIGLQNAELYEQVRQSAGELENQVLELRHVQEALGKSEETARALLNASISASYLIDGTGTLLACNKIGAQGFGKDPADIVGRSMADLLPPDVAERRRDRALEVFRTGKAVRFEDEFEDRQFDINIYPVLDGQGKVQRLAVYARDITEQQKAEKGRAAAKRELEQQRLLSMRTDRLISLGQMAAGIAHELNQPLAGVRGLAEHLQIGMDRGWQFQPERVRDKLTLIIEQADRMSHIIEHIRLFAREAGKYELRPVNVNEVVESSIGMLGRQFRIHGLELAFEPANNLPVVSANPFSLEEVVLNLMINARDAVEEQRRIDPGSSGRIELQTLLDRKDRTRPVKIRVIDRGVGISEETLPNVFDPFFTTKGPDKGTGLGLSICRSIVEQFGGTIEIQSQPGGTKVIVSLPSQASREDK